MLKEVHRVLVNVNDVRFCEYVAVEPIPLYRSVSYQTILAMVLNDDGPVPLR